MTDQPDKLADAEREVRAYAADSGDVVLRRALTAVLAELDRVRAELAEAQAEIARLTEENDKHRADYKRRGAEIDRSRAVVEAATALTAHFRLGFLIGSDEEMAKWQTAHDALCHRLLAAVEEGQKT